MRKIFQQRVPTLILDCVIGIVCVVGIDHVMQKAGIPVVFDEKDGMVRCVKVQDPVYLKYLKPGEFVRSVGGIHIRRMEDIEFLLDAKQIGDVVSFEIEHSDGSRLVMVPLTSYYTAFYGITASIVSGMFFLVGVFVYFLRPRNGAAILFHWGAVSTATMILVTWGRYTIEPIELGTGLRGAFFLAHGLLPVTFFHFSMVFPREKLPPIHKYIFFLYAVGIFLAIGASVLFFSAVKTGSLDTFGTFLQVFFTARWFLVIMGILGLLNMVHSYRTAIEEHERKKLRWVLWGFLVGFLPYLILWVVPQMVFKDGIVREEVVLMFSALVPLTFGISILKYRLLDIDLIVNRSVVYTLVMGLLLGVYAAIIGVSAIFVVGLTAPLYFTLSASAAIVVALLFQPLRDRVQHIIDKRFFRVRYNFREAQRELVEGMRHSLDFHHAAELIVRRVDELLSVERIGFFTLSGPGHRMHLLAHKNFDLLDKHGVSFETEKLKIPLHIPVARGDKIESGIPFAFEDEEVFRRWGMALVMTMLSEKNDILGFLVLGEKKSGARFTVEDIDLLNTVTAQAGLAIERITLQQKLLLEHAEAQRLEELNRLKSFFVSSVSHDLKTPLTSIRVFAELLQSKRKFSSKKQREYLEIIEGESDRLTRLINNVLDFAKLERGVMEYQFAEVQLNEIVLKVLRSMEYQFKMEQCQVHRKLSKKDQRIHADADAVAEGLINILSNAVKYSFGRKNITISTFHHNGFAGVKIDDKGIGITHQDIKKIFEPFFRAKSETAHRAGGAGLGLSLVKHMIEAHGGKIEVHSTPGKGSSFTLLFPLEGTL